MLKDQENQSITHTDATNLVEGRILYDARLLLLRDGSRYQISLGGWGGPVRRERDIFGQNTFLTLVSIANSIGLKTKNHHSAM